MTSFPAVELKHALDAIGRILKRMREAGEALPETIVLVGGSALAFHGIRLVSRDVDFYASNLPEEPVFRVENELREIFGRTFKIDTTASANIWGSIFIKDIEESPIVTILDVEGTCVSIRALSVNDLYVIKLHADREKDLRDLPGIAEKTEFSSLVVRFNQLLQWHGNQNEKLQLVDRFIERALWDFGVAGPEAIEQLDVPEFVKDMLRERWSD